MAVGRFAEDMTGQRFHRLTVLERAGHIRKEAAWKCLCDCGKETIAPGGSLRSGNTKSCGCLSREKSGIRAKEAFTKHGHFSGRTSSKAHNSYQAMIARCTKESHKAFPRYGGRGIKVCERWMTFENFLADMGEKPSPELSIDRINNDGDYEPGNCRWATDDEQNNNSSGNRQITYGDRTLTLAEWAEISGIPYVTLRWRLNAGWAVEDAMTKPVRAKATAKRIAPA